MKNVEDLATVFREVSKVIEPSVVNIRVVKTVTGGGISGLDEDLLRQMFPDIDGDGQPDLPKRFQNGGPQHEEGTGSGVIIELIDKGAYVLTNNHVAGDADEMEITLSDGRTIKNAKLIGH